MLLVISTHATCTWRAWDAEGGDDGGVQHCLTHAVYEWREYSNEWRMRVLANGPPNTGEERRRRRDAT
jgi:hypothetical protein